MGGKEFVIGGFVLGAGLVGVAGCAQDGARERAATQQQAALVADGVATTYAWGSGQNGLGFRPGATERAAFGVPAVAVSGNGSLYLLDAMNGRIVRAANGEVSRVAEVPVDANDLAVGPDGAFAVRRSIRPEVLVYTPAGELMGPVDTSAVESDSVSLGLSRRVVVTTAQQDTFTFGSPALPQLAGQVLHGQRQGAAFLANGDGVKSTRRADGELELFTVPAGGRENKATDFVEKRTSLGKGASARIVGVSHDVACARVEHVTDGADGIVVDREAVCVEVTTGKTVFRTKLPAAGAYVPHRELAFAGRTLAFVRPTDKGLEVTTWKIEGGAR